MSGGPAGSSGTARADVVIVGGGHNGLTAAAYLGAAGLRVVVLERLDEVGGAAVSAEVFPGVDARLSRYSYLVSLLPRRIVDDLRLDIRLARRRYSSYTPLPGSATGLLVDTADPEATASSFARVGAATDVAAWDAFGAATSRMARAVFPTMIEPLPTRSEARRRLDDDAVWADLVEQPVGVALERDFADDLVRGVVATDALIGTFVPPVDASLAANRCLLYHVIGGGTGHWDVPLGGMGSVSGALRRACWDVGVELVTGAEVTAIAPDGEVTYRTDAEHRIAAGRVLSGVAPAELARLVGRTAPADDGHSDGPDIRGAGEAGAAAPEGAQVKVNLLLRRLPRLADPDVDPAAAFGGTFHVNEGWERLGAAHAEATAGRIPDPVPCEIYCHSLTDPSILSPELRAAGAHTLTLFALQTPHRLIAGRDPEAARAELERAVLASLDAVLAEPIADLLMTDSGGRPCIETKTTADLEHTLRMPGGDIFHGPLSWPWAEDDAELGAPAARWGVATGHDRILLCGAGAQRGGAVSGIGGHNAAMAVLEEL